MRSHVSKRDTERYRGNRMQKLTRVLQPFRDLLTLQMIFDAAFYGDTFLGPHHTSRDLSDFF